jgi:hypothetical protein
MNDYIPRNINGYRDEEKHKWIGKDGKNFNSMVLNHKNLYQL